MSRKLFIAGNWKMNLDKSGATDLARQLSMKIGSTEQIDLAVAPVSLHIADVAATLVGTKISVAAQNMWHEDNGAYTGEISAAQLKDVGTEYVILGHSERRHVIGESDELINKKVLKALSSDLKVILCVGELLEERKSDKTMDVVNKQVKVGLEGVSAAAMANVTIAYEPVWAIGTGETATPAQAQEVHSKIRALLGELYDGDVAGATRIQYGGSVKPSNAGELLGQEDVDGALVGGASLKADDFAGIVEAALPESE
ncbi:MAG: triose-phosphate isomerase [Phycisphaerae bacterium]